MHIHLIYVSGEEGLFFIKPLLTWRSECLQAIYPWPFRELINSRSDAQETSLLYLWPLAFSHRLSAWVTLTGWGRGDWRWRRSAWVGVDGGGLLRWSVVAVGLGIEFRSGYGTDRNAPILSNIKTLIVFRCRISILNEINPSLSANSNIVFNCFWVNATSVSQ